MNLYVYLGVKRDASSDDIERAYRRLARRYHPGINPGDRVAEEHYRQIEQAYAVLGDDERRRQYDRGVEPESADASRTEAAVSFEGFDFSAAASGPLAATFSELFADVFHRAAREAASPSRGADIDMPLALTFDVAVRGGTVPVSVLRQDRCPHCAGSGRTARQPVACPACQGVGQRRWARGHMVFMKPCDACGGGGRLAWDPCRPCRGEGVQQRSEVVTLPIPPGIETGARLAVPGRGQAGARGGPAGDLYVTIEVTDHSFFRRRGRDLHLMLPLALHEAALGAKVTVPTLDGPVGLKVPPGSSSGRLLRLRGRGVPGRSGREEDAGDLIAEVQIVLPDVRDERSKALLREFGERHDQDVRAHLFPES